MLIDFQHFASTQFDVSHINNYNRAAETMCLYEYITIYIILNFS